MPTNAECGDWSRLIAIGCRMRTLLAMLREDLCVATIYKREAVELLALWDIVGEQLAPGVNRPSPVILLATAEELSGPPAERASDAKPANTVSAPPRVRRSRRHPKYSPREREELLLLMMNEKGPLRVDQMILDDDVTYTMLSATLRQGPFRSDGSKPSAWSATRVSRLWTQDHEAEHGPPKMTLLHMAG